MTVEAEQSVAFWKPYSKHIMLVSMRLLTLVSARSGACCVPRRGRDFWVRGGTAPPPRACWARATSSSSWRAPPAGARRRRDRSRCSCVTAYAHARRGRSRLRRASPLQPSPGGAAPRPGHPRLTRPCSPPARRNLRLAPPPLGACWLAVGRAASARSRRRGRLRGGGRRAGAGPAVAHSHAAASRTAADASVAPAWFSARANCIGSGFEIFRDCARLHVW